MLHPQRKTLKAVISFVALAVLLGGVYSCATAQEPEVRVEIDPTATAPPPTPTPFPECTDPEPAPSQRELLRYPERYANTCLLVIGEVVDVNTDSAGWVDVWIDTSGSFDRVVVYGPLKCYRDEGRVLEGDRVSVKAWMQDTPYQYESVGAGMLEVPIGLCAK